MYERDPNHDRALQAYLELNESRARAQAAADRLYDRGFYGLQRALATVSPNFKPCGDAQGKPLASPSLGQPEPAGVTSRSGGQAGSAKGQQ
jgi:hypothetical protein